MHLPDGTLLQGGRYEIIRYINSGGFGCTYEARDTKFKDIAKSLAIKEFFVKDFCNRNAATNCISVATQNKAELVEKLRAKFLAEAAALYGFNHPNIVRVTDTFEENGTAYYVMDYIEGCTLASLVEQKGYLSEDEALHYIRQVADALKYVHSHKRSHFDVKPQNIMIDSNGRAVLIDFGVSKQYDEANGVNTSTLVGYTPGYAPMELTYNDIAGFSPTTDIYSLGATLFNLVTGTVPPSASRVNEDGLPVLVDVSAQVFNAIKAAMQPRRKDRPQSIDEFLRLLESKKQSGKLVSVSENQVYVRSVCAVVNKYVCKVCGYIHEGNKAPDACPMCKAGTSEFASVIGPNGEKDMDTEEYEHESGKTIIDDKKDVELLRKAAEGGNKKAQYKLGTCYEKGIGVQRSVHDAVKWYRLAAEQGYVKAQRALEKLEQKNVVSETATARMSSDTKKGIFVVFCVIACLIYCISEDFDWDVIRVPLMGCVIMSSYVFKHI